MNRDVVRPACPGEAILVDEVGLESGLYGSYRLRSTYRPIMERRGPLLVPVAVEGMISPQLAGSPVPARSFFEAVPEDDKPFVENMCRALGLRNHRNIGVEGLALWFRYDPRRDCGLDEFLHDIGSMAGFLPVLRLDPHQLVCEVADAAALDNTMLSALAGGMRERGIRMAVPCCGSGHPAPETVARIAPDIVRVDGSSFKKFCGDPAAIRLLASMIADFGRLRTKVLIEGIDDAAQFGHAVNAGAGLFQGEFLRSPAQVGTCFDETPLVLSELLAGRPAVVPFGDFSGRIHQRP